MLKQGLFLILAQGALCSSLGAQEVELTAETGRDGKKREYTVLQETLESTPHWLPKEEDPPLPLPEAATIASSRLKPESPQDVEVVGFQLGRYLTQRGPRWYYIVSMYDRQLAYRDEPPYIVRLVILMDGTIVEGRIVD
jgi:hypothetical protein